MRAYLLGKNLVALALATMFAGPEALSHSKLRSASPPPDSTVTSALAEIHLVFNAKIEPALSSIDLFPETEGKNAATANQTCDETSCRMNVSKLEAGVYRVHYRVLSIDGHIVEGEYKFNVKAD